MAARLKVFVTTDGLTDYVVATSSRAKALAAWGIRQDVFKTGHARETDDADLVKAAQAKPGEVLRRSAKTEGALASFKASAPVRPKGPTAAQRKAVAALESKLNALDAANAKAKAEFELRRAALAATVQARDDQDAALRAKLTAALDRAREALD